MMNGYFFSYDIATGEQRWKGRGHDPRGTACTA